MDLPNKLRAWRAEGASCVGSVERWSMLDEAATEIERQRVIIDKLIDGWPEDGIPVELLDGEPTTELVMLRDLYFEVLRRVEQNKRVGGTTSTQRAMTAWAVDELNLCLRFAGLPYDDRTFTRVTPPGGITPETYKPSRGLLSRIGDWFANRW